MPITKRIGSSPSGTATPRVPAEATPAITARVSGPLAGTVTPRVGAGAAGSSTQRVGQFDIALYLDDFTPLLLDAGDNFLLSGDEAQPVARATRRLSE